MDESREALIAQLAELLAEQTASQPLAIIGESPLGGLSLAAEAADPGAMALASEAGDGGGQVLASEAGGG